jgi:hypothetical protein
VHDTDLAVTRREAVGIPLEVTERGQRGEHESARSAKDVWRRVEGVGMALRPTLLAYQFLYELRPETHNAPRAAVDAARAQDSALHGTDTRR